MNIKETLNKLGYDLIAINKYAIRVKCMECGKKNTILLEDFLFGVVKECSNCNIDTITDRVGFLNKINTLNKNYRVIDILPNGSLIIRNKDNLKIQVIEEYIFLNRRIDGYIDATTYDNSAFFIEKENYQNLKREILDFRNKYRRFVHTITNWGEERAVREYHMNYAVPKFVKQLKKKYGEIAFKKFAENEQTEYSRKYYGI